MTALAAARSVPRYGAGAIPNQIHAPQKASTKIWTGALVVFNAGFAAPATAAAGLVAIGVSRDDYDNLSGADGAKNVVVDQGVFPFVNSAAADAITQAHAGRDCYIVDDQTVALTNGTGVRSRAGKIMKVDADGVWVQVGLSRAAANTEQPAGAALVLVSNDAAPATLTHGAVYDVPTTAAATTITLPAASPTGTRVTFSADGVKNAHTVTYRDATGAVALTTALLALKRHQVTAVKNGAIWTAEAYTSP
jgi:hypothetical protein